MLKAGTLVNQCYILRDYLGEDSFSHWWRASAIFVASDFLLRFIKPEYSRDGTVCRQFIDSVRDWKGVIAPSILSPIEADRYSDQLFVASEYDGYTQLQSVFFHGMEFSIEHACRLAIELAQGLDCFHQHGITYGLLTGESIIVHKSNSHIEELKIQKPSFLPFLGLLADENIQAIRNNWGYAAPEIKHEKQPDKRSDIYSLGVILFYLLSGKLPYGTRSGLRVKERTAAPAHITAALARRGIPAEIATINLQALRKNPKLRYQNCLDLITDLQVILNRRREQSIRAGKCDPIAELATLNARKTSTDARDLVRTLDTVEYFSLLASAPTVPQTDIVDSNPAMDYFRANRKQIEDLEELEAEGAEDEDSIEVEAYVKSAYEKIKGELATGSLKKQGTGKEPIPSTGKGIPNDKQRKKPPTKAASNTANQNAAEIDRQTHHATDDRGNSSIQWVSQGGAPEQVIANILAAFMRAKNGRASFSFIEETGPGFAAELMGNAVSRMRSESLMLELGTFHNDQDMGLIVDTLRESLGIAVARETRRSTGDLARRLSKADSASFFSSVFEERRPKEPSRAPIPAMGTENEIMDSICAAVAALARPSRPLIITGHGGQQMSQQTHELLLRLASTAKKAPICIFIFFEGLQVPPWHSLSKLNASGNLHS